MNEIFKSELRIDKESYVGPTNIWHFLILRPIGPVTIWYLDRYIDPRINTESAKWNQRAKRRRIHCLPHLRSNSSSFTSNKQTAKSFKYLKRKQNMKKESLGQTNQNGIDSKLTTPCMIESHWDPPAINTSNLIDTLWENKNLEAISVLVTRHEVKAYIPGEFCQKGIKLIR